jgi:hypothetical protein
MAVEACGAGRPFHGRTSLPTRGRITRLRCNLTAIAGDIAAADLPNRGKTAESVNFLSIAVNN